MARPFAAAGQSARRSGSARTPFSPIALACLGAQGTRPPASERARHTNSLVAAIAIIDGVAVCVVAAAKTQPTILTAQPIVALLQTRCLVEQPTQIVSRDGDYTVLVQEAAKTLSAGIVWLAHCRKLARARDSRKA